MRPGMYISRLQREGLPALVWEIVDNSIDDLGWFRSHIEVFIEPDNSITVVDDGREFQLKYQKNRSSCR